MGLEAFIAERKKSKDLLVMAHVVCGYPSFEENLQELEIMAEAEGLQAHKNAVTNSISNLLFGISPEKRSMIF